MNKQSTKYLLGVTGGIAAYKSLEIARLLKEQGHSIRVVMTQHARAFVTPLSFQAISGHPVHTVLIDDSSDNGMRHIELAKWADIILIAPASANFIAKLSCGIADDLLTTICLASTAPIILAPATNKVMWENPATQNNINILLQRHVRLIGPDCGEQACGDQGFGRMSEPQEIVSQLSPALASCHKKIVITAGPTQEFIDPIRFITNKSSGKMGYLLAEAAASLGAKVILISGPVALTASKNIHLISVKSALEMHDAAVKYAEDADIFMGVAAVANYRIEQMAQQKIKSNEEKITLSLIKNPDIIKSIAHLNKKPFVVGFAAETEDVIAHAEKKLKNKNLDVMIANDVSNNKVMGSDFGAVTIIHKDGEKISYPEMPKKILALKIIEHIIGML